MLVAQEPYDISLPELLPGCHGLCLGIVRITEDLLQRCPDLLVVARHGAGTDIVDVEAASRLGIYVTCTPGANANAVAEYTIGTIICISRAIVLADQLVKHEKWRHPSLWGYELQGKNIGILGLGRVGQRTAQLANAFGMNVLAHDPFQPRSVFQSANAEKLDLDDLISRSSYLCLHLNLTDDSIALLSRQRLELLPKGAYLINMARAEIIDNHALKDLLDSGHLAGAALDVFDEEPPSDWGLARHPKVLASPHTAAWSYEAREKMTLGAAAEVIKVFNGEKPTNSVNNPKSPRAYPKIII